MLRNISNSVLIPFILTPFYSKQGQKLSIKGFVKVMLRSNFILLKICIFVVLVLSNMILCKLTILKIWEKERKFTYELFITDDGVYLHSESIKTCFPCSNMYLNHYNHYRYIVYYHRCLYTFRLRYQISEMQNSISMK